MNADDFPHVPRRRAAGLALRQAAGPARRVTELLALFFAVLSLVSAFRIALGVEYAPFSLQDTVTNLGAITGAVAAFFLLGRLPWAAPRTLLALATMPAATAARWAVEWWVHGNLVRGIWLELGLTVVLAALLFPVVYLVSGTISLIGALAAPDAYLGEDRQPSRGRGEGPA